MKPSYKKNNWRKENEDDNPLIRQDSYIPRSALALLRDHSRMRGLPMSRLMAIAIDNEFDQPTPFNYPCEKPKSMYQEFMYGPQAGKILKFLEKFPKGTGCDVLMLCRRDIGVPDREIFMLAYRELIEQNMIEEIIPVGTKFEFWNSDYKYVRVIGVDMKTRDKRFKRIGPKTTKDQRRIKDEDVER